MKINIAIDGPAGSGKSSVGAAVAQKLNYQFVDTGLTYRAFSYFCAKDNINFNNLMEIKQKLQDFNYQIRGEKVYVNNEDVTDYLQSNLVLDNINKITGLDFVRQAMVDLQQALAQEKGVVMVGRDITTIVLPTAKIKIYLWASIMVRAQRRWQQNNVNKINPNVLADIAEQLQKRDDSDINRLVGPLKIAPTAVVIDSSNLGFDEVVNKIYQLAIKDGK